jgi:hypothetical protein
MKPQDKQARAKARAAAKKAEAAQQWAEFNQQADFAEAVADKARARASHAAWVEWENMKQAAALPTNIVEYKAAIDRVLNRYEGAAKLFEWNEADAAFAKSLGIRLDVYER